MGGFRGWVGVGGVGVGGHWLQYQQWYIVNIKTSFPCADSAMAKYNLEEMP